MGETTTAWKQDGGNASNFSRQTVPFRYSPVASAAVFDPRDHGNPRCPSEYFSMLFERRRPALSVLR
jgi:hypothetical protein